MRKENFETVIKAFFKRRPFRPFTLELESGAYIEINHPEALRLQEDLVIYKSTSGIRAVFECSSVVRFIDATGTV